MATTQPSDPQYRAVVIIPTTGAKELLKAIDSVLAQTEPTMCYVVCDGSQYSETVHALVARYVQYPNFQVCYLPQNVGANGHYGHRIYAGFSHLVEQDYVLFLDQDNWLDSDHVSGCLRTIDATGAEWCYSLRKIVDKNGTFICNDDCESLGVFMSWTGIRHVDTNLYCIARHRLIQLSSKWHGGWGQDRLFFQAMLQHYPHCVCTGKYSVNYRLDGNPESVTRDFFIKGNLAMKRKYIVFPWAVK